MNKIYRPFLLLLFASFFAVACEAELDLQPEDERQTAESLFEDPEAYKQFLGKMYTGLSLSGQQGPSGLGDLQGLDEGFSPYLRLYFMLQELPTDEAVIGWNDGTIADLHAQNWTSGNEFVRTMFSRILYQVSLTNEFLRQTEESILDSRGVDASLKEEIQGYRAEARFLRALSYYHGLDMFGNPPFVTEDDPIGAFLPEQIQRADLFTWLEQELLAVEGEIAPAGQNEYGRADQAAVWMLLSKLYLNAEVYTGTPRYADVITYTTKIKQSGYSLVDDYQKLFLADNNTNGAQNEIIFPITFDGLRTQTFGGMTFIIHAAVGGTMDPWDYGVSSGWAGFRTTQEFVQTFPGGAESEDMRAMFHTDGQTLEVLTIPSFNHGYAIGKYKNLDVNGNPGSDSSGEFPDTDFPMFRLADAYLMYAEAVVRGGGGELAAAVGYVNELRERAYGDTSENISADQLTLDFLLDERARELYWEAHRRTDLIRFNQFSQNGIWAFKGGVPQGSTTQAFRNLFPIPASDIGVNTKLIQNTGY